MPMTFEDQINSFDRDDLKDKLKEHLSKLLSTEDKNYYSGKVSFIWNDEPLIIVSYDDVMGQIKTKDTNGKYAFNINVSALSNLDMLSILVQLLKIKPLDLIPCRYCGGCDDRLTTEAEKDVDETLYRVHCTSCGATGPYGESTREAETFWNKVSISIK